MPNSKIIDLTLKYILQHIFLPLLLGSFLYLFFSKNPFPIFVIFQNFQPIYEVPNFLIYQVPDGLWAYAFCAVLLNIWQNQRATVVAFSAFMLCIFYEVLQYLNLTAGTFDWWDIFAMAIGCFLAKIFTNKP